MGLPRPATGAVVFGKYTLVAKLAKGGMAEILLAKLSGAAGFEKLVCIKRILEHLAEDQQFVSMFLSEARIAAMISHPNVCQVFELGETEGSYYIAMEYLEGVPLAAFRRQDLYPTPCDPQLAVGIGVQACEGLHHAHELTRTDGTSLNVVHRDVSGQNLFVTTSGVVKVLDFGIAKIQDASARTTTGSVKGTYAYMAPEQLRGESIDRRADVFAMGIVMWETLAQQHLFRRETDFLTFQAISTEPMADIRTIRPDVPDALAAAISRALSRDREDRFPTARAFGEAMTRAVAPLGGPAGAASISNELASVFETNLKEQKALVRMARDGGAIDLATDNAPALGHGTSLSGTPTSSARPGHVARSIVPPGPRSQTLGVAPLAPREAWKRRGLVAVALLAVATIVIVIVGTRGKPTATSSEDGSAVVMAVEGPARTTTPATTPSTTPPPGSTTTPTNGVAAAGSATTASNATTGGTARTKSPRPPPTRPDNPPPIRTAATGPGSLSIDSTPVYATIVIDGKTYGETPLFNISLSPGKHVIKAISPSKATRVVRVTIESGKVAVKRIEW